MYIVKYMLLWVITDELNIHSRAQPSCRKRITNKRPRAYMRHSRNEDIKRVPSAIQTQLKL